MSGPSRTSAVYHVYQHQLEHWRQLADTVLWRCQCYPADPQGIRRSLSDLRRLVDDLGAVLVAPRSRPLDTGPYIPEDIRR